jgi:hypothetical protein
MSPFRPEAWLRVTELMLGAQVVLSWVAGLCFLKFWRSSRDRFFAYFAAAFWLLGLHWVGLAFIGPESEVRMGYYLVRLLAFLVIAWAIVDKNRQPGD